MIRFAIPACLIALLTAGSCARISTGPLPPSEWGGQHIGLTVLTLTVTLSDSGERLGTYTLVRGASPAVVKCL